MAYDMHCFYLGERFLPPGSPVETRQQLAQHIQDAVEGFLGTAEGRVPDRETAWLVERKVSPPQYVSHNSAGWHPDPWQARRFTTERDAHDYWRLMGEIDRPQFKVVEHLFINRP